MSRIGKLPIPLPPKVKVDIGPDAVVVTGPLGSITQPYKIVSVHVEGGVLHVSRNGDSPRDRAFHGLIRALLANHVRGVSQGYERGLEIHGVGYKAELLPGNVLRLSLGFSHTIDFPVPAGISVAVEEKGSRVKLAGADRQLIGHVASSIRALRKPEPYKGKGVRYAGEKIVIKAGKAATRK